MSFWLLISAAAVAILGAFFHGVIGRRMYLGEIYKGALPPNTISLSTVSWDMFTIMLAVSGAALVHVAYYPEAANMALPVIAMNFLGAALFIGLGLSGHKLLIRLPGAYLMAATGGLACIGLLERLGGL